jgi:hypothetical protein
MAKAPTKPRVTMGDEVDGPAGEGEQTFLPPTIGLETPSTKPEYTTGNLKKTGVNWTWILAGALAILVAGILLS